MSGRKIDFEFTERQKSVILGSMLGDGSLSKLEGNRSNSRFSEVHCIAQYDWLMWKKKELEPLPSFLTEGATAAKNDPARIYKNCMLRTNRNACFTNLEKAWYKRDENGSYVYKMVGNKRHRIKIIPADLKLDPLMVAVWYMDDGSNGVNYNKRQCNFATNCFTEEETNRLLAMLIGAGFVNACICRQRKDYVINIKSKSLVDFIEFVKQSLPDIPDCMKYKIDLSNYIEPYACCSISNTLAQDIFKDAKNKMRQIDIAAKYKIGKSYVGSIIRGKTRHRSDLVSDTSYANTTGTKGVSFDKLMQKYRVQIFLHHPDGRSLWQNLGHYKDEETAALVANESRRMRAEGITDPAAYKTMRKKYQNAVRRTNKSGVNGLYYSMNKWRPTICVGGIHGFRMGLGSFADKEDAVKVLDAARQMKEAGVTDRKLYAALRPAKNKNNKNWLFAI